MYPCSNPELVAAASAAGGIGIVQPLSLVYVHGHDFREGLGLIRQITDRPIGLNVIVEKSSKVYLERMMRYVGPGAGGRGAVLRDLPGQPQMGRGASPRRGREGVITTSPSASGPRRPWTPGSTD